MEIKYKNISCGYIGIANPLATNNSKFYQELFNHCSNNFTSLLIFPQRIPRAGFFEELLANETSWFQNKFSYFKETLKQRYLDAVMRYQIESNDLSLTILVNLSNLILRYGLSTELIKIDINKQTVALKIINETAKIEIALSSGKSVDVGDLIKLHDKILVETEVPELEMLILLHKITIYFYRHQNTEDLKKQVALLGKKLINLAELLDKNNFSDLFYRSMVYRGIAMFPDLPHFERQQYLNKAEGIARSLILTNHSLEKWVALDNLCNCLQSLAKWNLSQGKIHDAENNLLEMINLDSYDSTSHCELGFYYFKLQLPQKALLCFEKAVELGAPGMGMNMYYYAKCLQMLDRQSDMVDAFYKAAELDNKAVSPWLELLTHAINSKDSDTSYQLAKRIIDTPLFMEQLEPDEINRLYYIAG